AKLFSEAIEAIDWGQVDALTATGANPIQVVVHGVVPQVTPYMVAQVLYTFEVNIHSSTYLGLVGAGGLGLILDQYVGLFLYPEQMPAAGIGGQYGPSGGGFLTLPYLGDGHFVTSNFDHCGPTYRVDGVICRFDGTVAYAGNGRDPEAPIGYAMSSGKQDWLFYDGH